MTFGKTFSFAGCILVLKNASRPSWEKIETKRFFDAMNVILSLQVRIQPYKFYF
jgi:hypothetical protein